MLTMKTNQTKKAKNTRRPHVKWGSLIVAVILIIAEIVLTVLHFYANTGVLKDVNISIGFLLAYGFLFGFILLLVAAMLITDDFIPSYQEAQSYKSVRAYKGQIYKYVIDSYKKDTEAYNELLRYLEDREKKKK